MALATKKRPTGTSHKKRTGTHHRHSNHYIKTYWPYLPMLMIVAIGIVINVSWNNSGKVLGVQSDISAQALLEKTNAERLSHNETTLQANAKLTDAAQTRANDLVGRNYWSHTAPDGSTPWQVITSDGYSYAVAGENLAYGFDDANAVVKGWMMSPEHRANLLDERYQDVGFGIASSQNFQGHGPAVIVVAEYAQPGSVAASAPRELQARPVSRYELLGGAQAIVSVAFLSLLTGMAMSFFVIQHGFRLHRLLSRGEGFIVRHPYIDIAVVFIGTAGYILTRSGGAIH